MAVAAARFFEIVRQHPIHCRPHLRACLQEFQESMPLRQASERIGIVANAGEAVGCMDLATADLAPFISITPPTHTLSFQQQCSRARTPLMDFRPLGNHTDFIRPSAGFWPRDLTW
jgi:hypothetical protein